MTSKVVFLALPISQIATHPYGRVVYRAVKVPQSLGHPQRCNPVSDKLILLSLCDLMQMVYAPLPHFGRHLLAKHLCNNLAVVHKTRRCPFRLKILQLRELACSGSHCANGLSMFRYPFIITAVVQSVVGMGTMPNSVLVNRMTALNAHRM